MLFQFENLPISCYILHINWCSTDIDPRARLVILTVDVRFSIYALRYSDLGLLFKMAPIISLLLDTIRYERAEVSTPLFK